MKLLIPVLLLIALLTACGSKTQTTETQAPATNADVTAKTDTKDDAPADIAPANPTAENRDTPAKADEPRIEFPKIDAKFDSDEKDENGNIILVKYLTNSDKDSEIVQKLEAQILEAGFTPIPNSYHSNYEKVQGDQFVVINISEGEGEVWITMSRTRDPDMRYTKADPRIPYPLDQGFAAEYANQVKGDNGELTYTFYNRTKEFINDYEKRLQDVGFKKENTDDDNKLLYIKQLDNKTKLKVNINMLNERKTDMDIIQSVILQ